MVKNAIKQEAKYKVEELNHGRKVYDFLRFGPAAFVISMVLVVLAIVIIATKGFNKGLDFTGGSSIEISFNQTVELDKIRYSLESIGFDEPIVQNFGSSKDILLRLPPIENLSGNELGEKVINQLQKDVDQSATITRNEFVGPSVGDELAQDGILAILAALVCIMIYVAFRFEWRLGVGAVVALAHDVVIAVGYLSLFQRELDLTIIASLLSIIGYSLNDTIVVFDRIRENFRKIRRGTPYDVINISLTQTLSRTLMTSGTTLMVVLCLYFFGGYMLQGFAETLAIGIVLGTISSIYVAAYMTYKMGINREHLLPPKVEED